MLRQKYTKGSLSSLIVIVVALAATLGLVLYRQAIIDTVKAMQYQPSSAESAIRESLALTAEGKRMYDASQTAVVSATDFNKSCNQQKETNNPIVGCYANQLIYVYDIDNPKLAGAEETTAAHEVLHAVYERLSDDRRNELDRALEEAYERVKTDELEDRMEYYAATEPGERGNELHSILGTEFAQLGTELEAHYAQYFTDRKIILKFCQSYKDTFLGTLAELNNLAKQINKGTESANARIARYNSEQQKLRNDSNSFESQARSGGFDSENEFNDARSELISRQEALNAERQAIQRAISSIEALRTKYDALSDEYQSLARSINSSLAPTPKLSS